jgi:4-amino-4-deoxy-L-arabinose transferase-like glycosyltransferase
MSRLATVVCVLLLAIAIALQGRMAAGVLASDLAAPDPPAQFTTGVMVHDYLRYALWSNPVAFAESFYVRFPKVALGQWPPVYFAVQAAWYLVFPISPDSARVLSAAIALAMAVMLFLRLRRSCGSVAASAATAVFLSFQRIQLAAWEVMSDLLTGLFVLLAVLSLSTFLEEPRRRRSAWYFALWSSAALLTKGSAFPLAPFALLAPLLAWRPRCFGVIWYWASGIACAIASAPFYIFVARMGFGYPTRILASGADLNSSKFVYLTKLWGTAPTLVWTLAAVGFATAVHHRWRGANDESATTDALLAGTWILAQVLSLMAFSLTREPRVFIPALAPAAILFGYCVHRIQRVLRHRPVLAMAAPAVLGLLCIATCRAAPVLRIDGYQAAIDSIPYRPEGCLMLASGDASGQGAIVAERLAHDPWRSGIVLEASHVLAEASWFGRHYRALFADADEVRKYLMDLPVRYILLDDSWKPMMSARQLDKLDKTVPPSWGRIQPDNGSMSFAEQLDETVSASPQDFALLGRFPIHGSGRYLGEVRVYENLRAGERRPAVVRVRLSLDRGGRTLEYRWK